MTSPVEVEVVSPAADFPAAHSMDSGWFAVDKKGRIAHFSTGEAGAMPNSTGFATGEAGGSDGAERLWWEHILPWLARHVDTTGLAEASPELYALFDTHPHAAAAAAELGTEQVPMNELFIEVPVDEHYKFVSGVDALEGFVGFAPSGGAIEWEDVPPEFIPIAKYSHGDWDIPGHYERRTAGLAEFRLDVVPEGLEKMDTDFTEAAEIQLADFYSNEECMSWGEHDLRDGSLQEAPPRAGFWGWLFNVLRGGS